MKLFKVLLAALTLICFLTACNFAQLPTKPTDYTQATTEETGVSERTTEATKSEETTETTTQATTQTPATPAETTLPPTTQTPSQSNTGGVIPTTEVVSTADGYQIIREDRSYRNAAGEVLISHYFDYLELAETFPGAQKINAAFKQIAADFFWTEEELAEYAIGEWGPDPEYPFFCTRPSAVTYISDKYICVTVGTQWYMGGVSNYGHEGYVFDLQTGEEATLAGLVGGDPAQLEEQLKEIAWERISNDPNEEPWEGSYETLCAYTLETFNYAINDGQIVLFFSVYEFFSGAHGPVTVCTGIYI